MATAETVQPVKYRNQIADDKLAIVDRVGLPSAIQDCADEAGALESVRSSRAKEKPNRIRAGRLAVMLNLADQIRPALRPEIEAVFADAVPLAKDNRTARIAEIGEKLLIGAPAGQRPVRMSEAEVYLADANAGSQSRDGGQPALQIVQPGTSIDMTRLVKFAPYAKNVPQLGQDLMIVNYHDGVGTAGVIDDLESAPEQRARMAQETIKVKHIALRNNDDPLRIARAALNQNGSGYDLKAVNQKLAMREMQALVTRFAIKGDTALGLNGILNTGSVGQGIAIDKSSVNVNSASADDVAQAVRDAIATAIAARQDGEVDSITMDGRIAAKLRTPAASGGSHLRNLIADYANLGIVNWYELSNFNAGSSASPCMTIGNTNDEDFGSRLLSGPQPLVFPFAVGEFTRTYYVWPYAGVWTGISAFNHVATFAYS